MKKQIKFRQSGITIIELVILIVIIGIITPLLAVVITNAMRNTVLPEYYTTASSLAKMEIERVTNQRFSEIADDGPHYYTGSLSAYSYQISVDYVNDNDLNTPDPTLTDDTVIYKRVEITIRRAGFSDVSVVTLATNN